MEQSLQEIIASACKGQFETLLIKELARVAQLKTYQKGHKLLSIGAYPHSLPIVIDGRLNVLAEDKNGRELLMYTLSTGETSAIAASASLRNRSSLVNIICDSECTLLLVPIEYIDIWSNRYPTWKRYIMQAYEQRFEKLLYTVDTVAFKKMDERIIEYLSTKLQQDERVISITHRQIASELNSTREVVSRLLKKMEAKGIIRLFRNKIELLSHYN